MGQSKEEDSQEIKTLFQLKGKINTTTLKINALSEYIEQVKNLEVVDGVESFQPDNEAKKDLYRVRLPYGPDYRKLSRFEDESVIRKVLSFFGYKSTTESLIEKFLHAVEKRMETIKHAMN